MKWMRYNEWDTPHTSNLKIYFMMLKISCFSCWRFFNCELSHRYVMKMYCPSITILGYTSQSRKFEKLISIHLNNLLLTGGISLLLFRNAKKCMHWVMIPDSHNLISFEKHISVTIKYTIVSWSNWGYVPYLQKYKGER